MLGKLKQTVKIVKQSITKHKTDLAYISVLIGLYIMFSVLMHQPLLVYGDPGGPTPGGPGPLP